ncbi:MAG: T9SS type A sorting domain-containing protein [Bacteroidetes bacterium]|nr:T9SS type A sorting domain-containing protein [Bacteroidota bacterium]
MNNRKVLFGILAFVIAGSVVIYTTSGALKLNKYSPRNEQKKKVSQGINGAAEFLNNMRNNKTTGGIDSKWVINAREEVKNLANQKSGKSLDLAWIELGPDNIGGRTRAILFDRNNPNIIYAGAVAGGLWKSTTGGSSWSKVPSVSENIAVCAIAQASNGDIYVGTGESLGMVPSGSANGSTEFMGKGMYKSTNGEDFTVLDSTVPTTGNNLNAIWAFVSRIACDPVKPGRVYASTNKGLRSSDDGGLTWIVPVKNINNTDNTQNSTDVDVASDGTVISSVGGKCFISPSGDNATFVNHSVSGAGNLPTGSLSRIEFAVAPSNPNYMYACAAKTDGTLYNIYRSIDKGNTWDVIGAGGSTSFQPLGTQGAYDNTLVVHPTNPDKIFCGGLDMWEWNKTTPDGVPAGGSWTQKTLWYLSNTSPYFVHADHHFYVFHPTNTNIMFVGSDGGISRSTDGGNTFKDMNINYSTIQFYTINCSSTGTVMGGSQDNGTLYFPRTGTFPKHVIGSNTGISGMGGDGGYCSFSYINPEAFFTSVYYGDISRSPDNTNTFYDFTSVKFKDILAAFVTPFVMWESFNDTYSSDFVNFTPAKVTNENLGKGNADSIHYSGYLLRGGQPHASIAHGSVDITSGSISIHDNGSGQFVGATGTIDYNSGRYFITFSTQPLVGANILASYNTRFDAGKTIKIFSNNKPGSFDYTTPSTIQSGDTVEVQDIIQAKFYFGATDIWMTKQALNFTPTPIWYKIATVGSANPNNPDVTQCLALSHDGNYLFAGTSEGKVFRISNLRSANDSLSADISSPGCVVETKQLFSSSNRAVTSIAVDPLNAARVIVTLGNYGENAYVYYSGNALDSVPTFTSKQGAGTTALPKMPVYSSLIPIFHSGAVIVGTEYGVFSTDNITSANPQWVDENTGLDNVPVFMIKQQTYDYEGVKNFGTIYIGTHGRGAFECKKFTSINDYDKPVTGNNVYSPFTVSIYPNPVVDNATLSFTLPANGEVKVKIYDLNGKLVKYTDITSMPKGYHTYSIDCKGIQRGSYIVQMISGTESATTRFIKMQ